VFVLVLVLVLGFWRVGTPAPQVPYFNHGWTRMNTDGWVNYFSRKKAHKAQKVEIKGEIGAGSLMLEAGCSCSCSCSCSVFGGWGHPRHSCRPDVLIGRFAIFSTTNGHQWARRFSLSLQHQASSIKHQVSSIQPPASSLRHPILIEWFGWLFVTYWSHFFISEVF
jgi:hypothetical protein